MDLDDLEEFLQSDTVFKDECSLLPGYLPPEQPCRETHVTALIRAFRPLLQQGPESTRRFGCSIAVTGPAGSGKTVTVRRAGKLVEELAERKKIRLTVRHASCRQYRSLHAVLVTTASWATGKRMHGTSTAEITDILLGWSRVEDRYLVLVADDAHLLSLDDIEATIGLVEWMEGHLTVILVARGTEWELLLENGLDQQVTDHLVFDPYTGKELVTLLRYRAGLAFKEGATSRGLVEKVAELANQSGSARHGIDLLYRAGKLAGREGMSIVTPEHVEKVTRDVTARPREEVLDGLTRHELYAALGITARLTSKRFTGMTVKEAYRYYQMTAGRRGELPNKEIAFRNYLETLEAHGLIKLVRNRGKRGNGGSRLRITVPGTPARVLAGRITERLEKLAGGTADDDPETGPVPGPRCGGIPGQAG